MLNYRTKVIRAEDIKPVTLNINVSEKDKAKQAINQMIDTLMEAQTKLKGTDEDTQQNR